MPKLSDEHKAKMAAGRAAAKARKATAVSTEALNEPDAFSDADLGIGEPEGQADPLAALMANPDTASRVQAMIDAAVAKAVGERFVGQPNVETGAMAQLAASFEKMLQIQAMQMPGYFKPLPSDEVERRLEGRIEMFSLLAEYKKAGTPPCYFVGPNGFYAGAYKYEEGQPIRTYLPPPEDFDPNYTVHGDAEGGMRARKVLDAQIKWLGGSTPHISDQVAEAERFAHSGIPLVGDDRSVMPAGPVEVIEGATPRPRKAGPAFPDHGETVQEPRRPQSMKPLPGDGGRIRTPANAPVGPAFVE